MSFAVVADQHFDKIGHAAVITLRGAFRGRFDDRVDAQRKGRSLASWFLGRHDESRLHYKIEHNASVTPYKERICIALCESRVKARMGMGTAESSIGNRTCSKETRMRVFIIESSYPEDFHKRRLDGIAARGILNILGIANELCFVLDRKYF